MQAKEKAKTSLRAEPVRWLLVLIAGALPLLLGQQAQVSTTQDFAAPGDLYNVTGLRVVETGENGAFRWGGAHVEMQAPAPRLASVRDVTRTGCAP